jgi:hypothetical protein
MGDTRQEWNPESLHTRLCPVCDLRDERVRAQDQAEDLQQRARA